MTPQQFQQKWGPGGPAFHLNEEQGAQSHFLDLCELLGVHKPGSEDGYLFEEKNSVIGGRTGYAADSAYESVIQVVPPLSCFSVVWNLPIGFGTALKNMRYIRWLSPALI